jgi:hypothetical protein
MLIEVHALLRSNLWLVNMMQITVYLVDAHSSTSVTNKQTNKHQQMNSELNDVNLYYPIMQIDVVTYMACLQESNDRLLHIHERVISITIDHLTNVQVMYHPGSITRSLSR